MTNALLVLTDKSVNYVPHLAGTLGSRFGRFSVESRKPSTLAELSMWMKAKNADVVVTTSLSVAKMADPFLEGSEDENRGSVLPFTDFTGSKQHKLLLAPQFVTVFSNGGRFLLDHFFAKLNGAVGVEAPQLKWAFVTPQNLAEVEMLALRSFVAAVDIETVKENRRITSVSYTFAYANQDGDVESRTYVIRCDDTTYPFCVSAMRILNATAVPKIFHNGQYDNAYFLRFNAPVHNWRFDSYTLMKELFPEFPKTLHYCASFFLRNYRFWKDESKTNLYEYNAKDTHYTLWTFLAMMQYCSQSNNRYALNNYAEVFPKIFPYFSCGMTGIDVHEETRLKLRAQEQEKKDAAEKSIRTMLGIPGFNPNSSQQVLPIMQALGHKKAESTEKKEMQKFAEMSPLNQRIVDAIKAYRKASKAISTYFDAELYEGRLYYSLDPSGTLSGRSASRESHFWCGTQIQNIPSYARAMCIAPDGWEYGAVDKAQAESYCTAYIAEDLDLVKTVTTSPDFHCQNASMFFGIPFEQLYDVEKKKKLRPDIRDLAKRVNHGANYNMGPDVLLDTMGTKAVMDAKRLLNLPGAWPLRKVCEYLLSCFDRAYPRIRGDWQKELKDEVQNTGRITAPDGWVIRTFMQPWKSKLDLNSCVSLKPQGYSARLVNKALYRVWRELQLKKYRGRMRLIAQIHDEILFTAHTEIVHQVAQEVADMMVIPSTINGRVMTIPSTFETHKIWSKLK